MIAPGSFLHGHLPTACILHRRTKLYVKAVRVRDHSCLVPHLKAERERAGGAEELPSLRLALAIVVAGQEEGAVKVIEVVRDLSSGTKKKLALKWRAESSAS